MAYVNDAKNAPRRRDEQRKRWDISDTNKASDRPRDSEKSRVKFNDGCVFLAACSSSDTDEVERLLSKGADINGTNVDGLTALHQACIDNNFKMVKFLVERGADINACDNEGWTVLHATSSCGFDDIARYLIENGVRLDAANNDNELAADLADNDEMKTLLTQYINKLGVDVDAARNMEQMMMLDDASQWLKSGKYADRPHEKTGAMALHVAAAKGYTDVIRVLLKAGADIEVRDNDCWTPLHAAAHWGQAESCEILAQKFASFKALDNAGQTPIDVAAPLLEPLLHSLQEKQESMSLGISEDLPRPSNTAARRSSIVRMSSDRKQDMVTKTVEDERIKVGVLRAVVDEAEERDVSLVDDENEEEGVDEESEKSDDTNKSDETTSEDTPDTVDSVSAADDKLPTKTTLTPSDNQRGRLSDLAMEPVDSRHSVTATSTDTTDVQSAVAGVAADSKISRLSRESDLSALTDKEESERTERPKEAVSTVVVETVHSSSQPEIRSKRVGIIYQSSLPERISIHSSKDDKDGVRSVRSSASIELKTPVSRASSAPPPSPSLKYISSKLALLSRNEPLQRRPYTSVFCVDDDSKISSAGVSSGVQEPAVATSATEQPLSSSVGQRPVSVIPLAEITTSVNDVAVTADEAAARPASVSSGVDRLLTLQPAVDGTRDVAVTSSTTSLGGTSSIFAQLSYAQPSIELLRRRRAADTTATSDAPTVSATTQGQAPTHLLSSHTQAALAALASTPRRSIELPKRDEEKEVERKARAKRARETRRSTQGVTREDLVNAEKALQAANTEDSDNTSSTISSDTTEQDGETSQTASNDVTEVVASSQADVTTTSSSLIPVSAGGGIISSEEISLLPSSHRMSAYRSKYLQEKEQEQEQSSTRPSKNAVSLATADQKDVEKEDPSQKSSAIRARRKRDSRRSTGKICSDECILQDDDSSTKGIDSDEAKLTQDPVVSIQATQKSAVPSDVNYKMLYESERTANDLLRKELQQLKQELNKTKSEVEVAKAVAVANETSSRRLDVVLAEKQALEKRIAELEEQTKLYESESTANDLLRKELQQLKQELNKTKSEVEVARAVAVANETSSRRLDAAIAEKQPLEKRVAELEEQTKVLETLRAENKKVREENGSLIRVISKLSK